jgi:hypothetical protein
MSKIFNKQLEDVLNGVPYQKFYSRTPNSRMLMPDVHYSMNHYLTDIEQRIQYHDVWKKSGWGTVKNSEFIQANPGLKKAFDNLHDGTKPQEQTWGNVAATRYAEFEAYKRLFLNPSAGLKHLIKLSGDVMSVGIKPVVKAAPETFRYVAKNTAEKLYDITPKTVKGLLSKVGVTSDRFTKSIMDNYTDSIIQGGRLRDAIMDMGIDSTDEVFNGIKAASKNLWQTTQDIGATWINLAELIDRGTSVNVALQISAKRGMTIDQALYGTYDLILKNNFLYGQFNPEWLRNPKIRAVFMFQATPFKLFEKRLVNAQRSYSSIKDLPGDIQKLWKTTEGRNKVIQDVKDLRHLIRTGESELKANLFIGALKNETDFFGTPVVQQFVRDVLTVGGATYAAGQAGMSVFDHFMHIPFLSTQSEEGKPQLALSPAIAKTMEGYAAWKNREVGDDFLLSTIMRRWLGPTGPLPATLEKAARLHNGDIPEVYQRGGSSGYLKYLFGVPGKEKE